MRTRLIHRSSIVIVMLTWIFFCMIPNPAEGSSSEEKKPIKIGVIMPLSGPAATTGGRVVVGMKAAAKRINDAGGVLGGHPLELLIEDGRCDPAESVSAANKLIMRDRVPVLIGAYASSATLAVMPITRKNRVPHIVVISEAEKITQQGHKFLFRISARSSYQAEFMKPYYSYLGFKNVALLPVNNDWGRSVAKYYSSALEAIGARVATVELIPQGEVNFLAQLTKVQNSGADSFIVFTDIESLGSLLKQSAELGMKNMLRFTGGDARLAVEVAGKIACEDLYCIEPYNDAVPTPENRIFKEVIRKAYPEMEPDYVIAQGYMGINTIADALNRAGKTDPIAVRDALAKTRLKSPRGLIEFDENGQCYLSFIVFQFQADGSKKRITLPK